MRVRARPKESWLEFAGCAQNRIANRFSFESPHGIVVQQRILRIQFTGLRINPT